MPAGRRRILVVNPNSNTAVTAAIAAALKPLEFAEGPEFHCVTLAEGPPGIETQADADSVVMPLLRLVERDIASHAFIIACYSDPGLHVCREGTSRPVFGIAACGIAAALTRGDRFGVIAIRQQSIRRHLRYLRQMGLEGRLAGERPLDASVAETASAGVFDRMVEIGRLLKEQDGAETIVLGCAGMARHRAPLNKALGLPVIDPTQAAAAMAVAALQVEQE